MSKIEDTQEILKKEIHIDNAKVSGLEYDRISINNLEIGKVTIDKSSELPEPLPSLNNNSKRIKARRIRWGIVLPIALLLVIALYTYAVFKVIEYFDNNAIDSAKNWIGYAGSVLGGGITLFSLVYNTKLNKAKEERKERISNAKFIIEQSAKYLTKVGYFECQMLKYITELESNVKQMKNQTEYVKNSEFIFSSEQLCRFVQAQHEAEEVSTIVLANIQAKLGDKLVSDSEKDILKKLYDAIGELGIILEQSYSNTVDVLQTPSEKAQYYQMMGKKIFCTSKEIKAEFHKYTELLH